MKIIRENIQLNFEGGQDPKKSMGIGKKALIEKWLTKMGLIEDCVINEDLTIDYSPTTGTINLDRMGTDELPSYIQFNEVHGGFSICNNNLKSLRGCPEFVFETNDYKGNFKCNNNNLNSLEGAPRNINGNFICHTNPGHFSRKDVEKVCRVKTTCIWGDDRVNESMEFQRGEDPRLTMDIGFHSQVRNWFQEHGISSDPEDNLYVEYRINKNGTIDVLEDISLSDLNIEDFPYFIKFGTIFGSFYVSQNIFTSLKGFPKVINGDISIYSNKPGARKWKENELRRKIKIQGKVWN
jgi:hypothetical protein